MDVWTAVLIVYGAGVAIGLVLIDEPFPARLGVAAIWPLGPMAFVVTITVLLLVLPIALPRAAIVLAILAAAFWWLWTRF